MKQASDMLEALSKHLSPDVVKKHLRAGARVIQAEARQNAPGGIAETIGIVENPDERIGVILTARRSKRYPKGYIAHIVEYGAAPHPIKSKKGKKLRYGFGPAFLFAGDVTHPGVGGKPFMRPAWETKKKPAEAKIGQGLKKELDSGFAKGYKNARMR
jgi:hypothetical protein